MKTSLKLKTLAAAAATCVGLLAAAPAHALVYAVSHLKVEDFTLAIGGTGVSTSITSFSFDMTNSASMNAATAGPSVAGCSSLGGCGASPSVLNPLKAQVGLPVFVENDFIIHSPPGGTSFSRADGLLSAAELVDGIPTSFELIAESLLNINGQAAANADVQSSTNINISFSVLDGPASLVLSFSADPDQQVINSGAPGIYLSQANMTSSFTLTEESTGDSIQWSPLGPPANNNCTVSIFGASCVEDDDTQRLNGNLSTGVNPNTLGRSFDLGDVFTLFGITIDGLPVGDYSIALNAGVSTSVRQTVVPEPGALALVGVALAGLSLVGRRRKQQRQA